MVELKIINRSMVKRSAEIYASTYGKAPWNEEYDADDIEKYILGFLGSDTKCAYALVMEESILGIALGGDYSLYWITLF